MSEWIISLQIRTFGHGNIIKYSKRPFLCDRDRRLLESGQVHYNDRDWRVDPESVQIMDDTIINNINSVVNRNDTLWFLGDFCFGPRDSRGFMRTAERYRNRINCDNIVLIWGNHDPKPFSKNAEKRQLAKDFARLFCDDYHLYINEIQGRLMSLCHYSMEVWDKSHGGAWCLYGHSHGSLPDNPHAMKFDCGVDCHNYKPLSFPEVAAIMAKKIYKPVDHHGAD